MVSIVQDLPISKPFVPSEIDRVAAAKAVQEYAPRYLDLLSGGPRLHSVIERIKSLGAVLNLATCNVRAASWQWRGRRSCCSRAAHRRRGLACRRPHMRAAGRTRAPRAL